MLRREVIIPVLPRLSLLERVAVAVGVLTVALAIVGGTMESARDAPTEKHVTGTVCAAGEFMRWDGENWVCRAGFLVGRGKWSDRGVFAIDRGDITIGGGATWVIDSTVITGRITPWHGQAVTLSPDTISAPRIRARNASDERPAR